MNNETEARDALVERIAELADQFACGAAGEPVVYALHGPTDFAEEVIALVTAARDAEIRERLLSEEAVDAGGRVFIRYGWVNKSRAKSMDVIEAALDYIGLGDGTGGQG